MTDPTPTPDPTPGPDPTTTATTPTETPAAEPQTVDQFLREGRTRPAEVDETDPTPPRRIQARTRPVEALRRVELSDEVRRAAALSPGVGVATPPSDAEAWIRGVLRPNSD